MGRRQRNIKHAGTVEYTGQGGGGEKKEKRRRRNGEAIERQRYEDGDTLGTRQYTGAEI